MLRKEDSLFMRLAIQEARKGMWKTSPNPCVGAIVVKNGEVVGKGFHRRAGTPHAEVNALLDAGVKAKDGTIYVTLEPCNHTGRTPPCTEAILASGINRVVVGMPDPNPYVAGSGSDYLEKNGLTVTRDILLKECRGLNRPYIKHITTGKPWVILKAGMSLDGKLAVSTGHSNWITNEQSRAAVHRLRHNVDAILVGRGTALHDNPSLTTRLPTGKGRDPIRVVIDSLLRLSPAAKMLQQNSCAETWIYCSNESDKKKAAKLQEAGARITCVNKSADGLSLDSVLVDLGKKNITSLLVEGGSSIHSTFLKENMADEVNLFIAPLLLGGDGLPIIGPTGYATVEEGIKLHALSTKKIDDNILVKGFINDPK